MTYRTDHLGSFIVPDALKAARKQDDKSVLQQEENTAIKSLLQFQNRDIGLSVVTDGELRRPKTFNKALEAVVADGWDETTVDKLETICRAQTEILRIEANFLQANAPAPFKLLLASPGHMLGKAYKGAPQERAAQIAEEIAAKLVPIAREQIAIAADAGTDYIQFENSAYATLLATNNHAGLQERGFDPAELLDAVIAVDSLALEGLDLSARTVGQQICRGGSESWFRTQGNEQLAKTLFTRLPVNRFNFKFDPDMSTQDLHFLRWLPTDKTLGLGLMDGKSKDIEAVELVAQMLDTAATLFPKKQTALYLQGGFRSHDESQAELQTTKLKQAAAIAEKFWNS